MIILDTNVVSEVMKQAASPQVSEWIAAQSPDLVYTTSVTMAEILYGIEILPRGRRRTTLETSASRFFEDGFAGHILPFDQAATSAFAFLGARKRAAGRSTGELDLQIAAIALSHGASLATRNVRDFEDCGIELVNPWD